MKINDFVQHTDPELQDIVYKVYHIRGHLVSLMDPETGLILNSHSCDYEVLKDQVTATNRYYHSLRIATAEQEAVDLRRAVQQDLGLEETSTNARCPSCGTTFEPS